MFSQKDLLKIGKGHDMNYKKEIIEMIREIKRTDILIYIYKLTKDVILEDCNDEKGLQK